MSSSKLDEVAADTVLESCRVLSASEVPDLAAFLQNEAGENTFFYRYEYNPFSRDKTAPLFALPGGQPAPRSAAAAPAAESKRKPKQPRASASQASAAGTSGRAGHCRGATAAAASAACAAATERAPAAPAAAARAAGQAESSTSTRQQEPSTTAALEASAAALVTSLSAPRPAHGSTSREDAASGSDTPREEASGKDGSRKESRLEALQKKLDRTWPPFTDVNGVFRHELRAVIPAAGERYAGEPCARCEIPGAPHTRCGCHHLTFATCSHRSPPLTPPCPRARTPGPAADAPLTLTRGARVRCCGRLRPGRPGLPHQEPDDARGAAQRPASEARLEPLSQRGGRRPARIRPEHTRRLGGRCQAGAERYVRPPCQEHACGRARFRVEQRAAQAHRGRAPGQAAQEREPADARAQEPREPQLRRARRAAHQLPRHEARLLQRAGPPRAPRAARHQPRAQRQVPGQPAGAAFRLAGRAGRRPGARAAGGARARAGTAVRRAAPHAAGRARLQPLLAPLQPLPAGREEDDQQVGDVHAHRAAPHVRAARAPAAAHERGAAGRAAV